MQITNPVDLRRALHCDNTTGTDGNVIRQIPLAGSSGVQR